MVRGNPGTGAPIGRSHAFPRAAPGRAIVSAPAHRAGRFARAGHDHDDCVRQALADAEALCAASGARLTELRRRVLELVWESHTPLGAYELLAMLRAAGRPAAPPTVYRALDFLLDQGLVHRLASRNAFVGCAHPGHDGPVQFLICQRCGNVAELDDPGISAAIAGAARARGFASARHTVEVSGTCPDCQARS